MKRAALLAVVLTCVLAGCSVPVDQPPPTPESRQLSLGMPRAVHQATVLQDGRVLITGGCSTPGCGDFELMRDSVLFDPSTQLFVVASRMVAARASGTGTLLQDGRVLLTGGYPAEGSAPSATAEIYDPVSAQFSAVGSMSVGRADHSATLLPDGRVLIAGGSDAAGPLNTTEYFDPSSHSFEPGQALVGPISGQAAVNSSVGVLLIGGTTDGDLGLGRTQILSATGWQWGPELSIGRVKHAAALLPDGQVLVIGGSADIEGDVKLGSTEIVDPATGSVRPGPSLPEPVYKLAGAVGTLPDGRVVIGGGSRLVVFDPASGLLSTAGLSLPGGLSFTTVSVVGPDQVLLAGGYDKAITPTDWASVQAV